MVQLATESSPIRNFWRVRASGQRLCGLLARLCRKASFSVVGFDRVAIIQSDYVFRQFEVE